MRDFFSSNSAPKGFSGGSIQAKHDIFVCSVRMGDAKDPLGLVFGFGQGGVDFSGIDGCKDENFVAPDNRRGTAVAINRFLPLDILIFTPVYWRFGGGRGSGGIGSTPVMPVVGFGLGKIGGV